MTHCDCRMCRTIERVRRLAEELERRAVAASGRQLGTWWNFHGWSGKGVPKDVALYSMIEYGRDRRVTSYLVFAGPIWSAEKMLRSGELVEVASRVCAQMAQDSDGVLNLHGQQRRPSFEDDPREPTDGDQRDPGAQGRRRED